MFYNSTRITQLNAHKKIVKMENVVSEIQYNAENMQFQKDWLNTLFDREIGNQLQKYRNAVKSYNEDASSRLQNIIAILDNKYNELYVEIRDNFNKYKDKLVTDFNEFDNATTNQLQAMIVDISEYENDIKKSIEALEKFTLNDMDAKISKIRGYYKDETERTKKEIEQKIEALQQKEGIDGFQILKQYEAMVKDLKEKLNLNINVKSLAFSHDAFKNIRDMLYLFKEGMNHARKKLLGIQSVSSTNITAFIKRERNLMTEYKTDCDKHTKEINEIKHLLQIEEQATEKDVSELSDLKEENETQFLTEYSDKQTEYENLKEKNKSECKKLKSKVLPQKSAADTEIKAMLQRFDEEEKDQVSANKIAQDGIAKRVESALETVAKLKEKNEMSLKYEKENGIMYSEQRSVEMDQTAMSLHRDFLATQASLNEIIKAQSEKLPAARLRLKQYNEYEKEKNKLQETLTKLLNMLSRNENDSEDNDSINHCKDLIKKILDEEAAVTKNANDKIAQHEAEFEAKCNEYSREEDEKTKEALENIREEYKSYEGKPEQEEREYYQSLVSEYDSIVISPGNEAEQKAEYKSLMVKKKDLLFSVINQKEALLNEFTREFSAEDERFQSSLVKSFTQENTSTMEPDHLRDEFNRKIKILEDELHVLTDQLQSLVCVNQTKIEEIDDSEEAKKLRTEIRNLMKSMNEQVVSKEEEIKSLVEQDRIKYKELELEALKRVTDEEESERNKINGREKQIQKLEHDLESVNAVFDQNSEFARRSFEMNKEIITKRSSEQISVINNQIEALKKAMIEREAQVNKEADEMRVKLVNSAFELSTNVENKLCAMRDKRDSFIDQYNKVINEQRERVESLKEAYRNRPLGKKEKMIIDELSKKKEYLDEVSKTEAKTIKRFVSINLNQENNFNKRFGNKLNVGKSDSMTRFKNSSRLSKIDPLPPVSIPVARSSFN